MQETNIDENKNKIETKTEIKMNNTFNKLKNIQSLLKREAALNNLYSNTFQNIQNDVNKICREIFEQKLKVINVIKSGEIPNVVFNHELIENNKEYMKELYLYIPKLLIHLWENPPLMAKLLLSSANADIKQYLAPLICDNFYENILSPNYLEDKLVLIIYILLEEEINKLKDVNDISKFLNNTPCSLLLNQLISKKDIKEFFRIILKDNIENFEALSGDTKLILDPTKIEKLIVERQKLQRRKTLNKKNEKKKEEPIQEETKKQISEEEKKMNELFFTKYSVDMSIKSLKNEKKDSMLLDNELLEQYIKFQFVDDENADNNIYSNKEFFKLMNTNSENAHEILKEYEYSFIKVINFLDSILEVFIENLDLLPFSMKCICKIISILLEKRFPGINKIQKYSFISKFIYNNLLVPVLINPTQGALINNYIISNNTMYNMNVAINIIEKFTSFVLYNPKKDSILSPFNNYFLGNIHKLIKINDVLINTKIPIYIEKIVEGKISINSKYEYFKENNNEILYSRSMFLSMNHVKVIMKGIIHLLQGNDNFFQKIVSKIIDNNENMQYLIELSDQNEKIIKKTVKNEKGRGKIQRNEQNIKYFLINDIIYNDKYKNLLNNNDVNNTYFKLEENKKVDKNNTKEMTENLIIKTKNLISASLSNYKILEEIVFGSENIGNTFDILKKLKYFMKSTNYVVDEGIPSEWYIGLLLENLKKLPEEYKVNDYEKLYDELENDIKKTMESRNFEQLSIIVAKMRFSKRRKDFYNHLKDVLIDINLNNKINNIIENDEINVKLYFKYDDKKKLNIYKEDLSERQLEFLNSFVFQDDKDAKTCKTIKSFTNIFPDINKIAANAIETKNVFDIQKELNVPKEINEFFNIIKNYLVKKIKDENELNLIYNKIYDHVWSKIYNKLYPKQSDIMNMSLQQKFNLYSWIEPFHLIKENNNYNFELILPKIINYFEYIDIEKSPRKKIMNVNLIFEAINTLLEFNQDKINIGVDNQMPLLNYIFIKAKPKNIFTNCEFMELYIGDKIRKKEGNYLVQLKSIRDFTLSLTHKNLFNITIEEFNNNCKLALESNEK